MSPLSPSPPPGPFSLQEFGNLVAHALDAESFSESFLAQSKLRLGLALESPAAAPETGSAPEHSTPELLLAGATIAHAHTSEEGTHRGIHGHEHGSEPEGRDRDREKGKEKGGRGGAAVHKTENSPLFPLGLATSPLRSSPSTTRPPMTFSTSARREDRGKAAVAAGPRLLLDKFRRHVLRATPTSTPIPTSTPDTTHRMPAPTVLAPSTKTTTEPPTPTTQAVHPYSHPTLLSGFFDFHDDEAQDDVEEFIPYVPLASQYERQRLEEERRARKEREKKLEELELEREREEYPAPRERPSRRSIFSRPASSLTEPPPSPSCSVSTTASSHAPVTPTASLFPYPPYTDTSSDADADADADTDFYASPSRWSTHSSAFSASSNSYSASFNSSSNSGSSRPRPDSHSHVSRPDTADSHSSAAASLFSHAYPQFADHPFARAPSQSPSQQDDPFAKASVQVVPRSPVRSTPVYLPNPNPNPNPGAKPRRQPQPQSPPPACPLPPPPSAPAEDAGEDAGEDTGEEADPVLPDEWTLWLGVSDALPAVFPSPPTTTTTTTTTTPPTSPTAPAPTPPRRSSPPSSYTAPHTHKPRARTKSKSKPRPALHLTVPAYTPTPARKAQQGGDEDWTLSLPFVRPPAHATSPPSWYAPSTDLGMGPPSPPARYRSTSAVRVTVGGMGMGRLDREGEGGGRPRVASEPRTHVRIEAPARPPSTWSAPTRRKPPRTAESAFSLASAESEATILPRLAVAESGWEDEGERTEGERAVEDEMDAESMASGTYYSARSSLALMA